MAPAIIGAGEIIDLTSSPEPEDQSPARVARTALQSFQPRQAKQATNSSSSTGNGGRAPKTASARPLSPRRFQQPREQERRPRNYSFILNHGYPTDPTERARAAEKVRRLKELDAAAELRHIRSAQQSDPANHVEYELPSGFKQDDRPVNNGFGLPAKTRANSANVKVDVTQTNDLSDRPHKRQRIEEIHQCLGGFDTSDKERPRSGSQLQTTTHSRPQQQQSLNGKVSRSSSTQSFHTTHSGPLNLPQTSLPAVSDATAFVPPRSARNRMSAAASLRLSLNAEKQNGNGRSLTNHPRSSLLGNVYSGLHSPAVADSRPPIPDGVSTPDAMSSRSDSEPSSKRIRLSSEFQRATTTTAKDMVQFSQPKPLFKPASAAVPRPPIKTATTSNHGAPYTPQEDQQLWDLKEHQGVSWADMSKHFNGRTEGSLRTRFSSVVRMKFSKTATSAVITNPSRLTTYAMDESSDGAAVAVTRPRRKKRNNDFSVVDGMISWADVKRGRLLGDEPSQEQEEESQASSKSDTQFKGERAYPKSIRRLFRDFELDRNLGRGSTKSRSVPDELIEHVFDDVGPRKYFKGTSSDVTCLSWASDGRHFAAASIAISDDRSMQYNKPNNLLLGDFERSMLVELPEHHIARPVITDNPENVNGLHSMRESQDSRLFMTVAAVQFSPDSKMLYSAGSDCKVRAYQYNEGVEQASCIYELDHPAPLDLLSVNRNGLVATGCHQATDGSIRVFDGDKHVSTFSPSRSDMQTSRAIYPSALRWGASHRHQHLLLAGFSIDSFDEERDIAGETCLWDIVTNQRLEFHAVTRNVFDVAWHPNPTSTSQSFAVATSRGASQVNRTTRSVVQCFAPRQQRAFRVMELECPAFDINDVVYNQYDDNYIAAGATDGKVYVWDQRFANPRHRPLHVLEHGESLNVLDHDRDVELADTGIRFLAWGATSSRLYTGSSDGVVKVWNPYMAPGNAHVKDVATFSSAVMSAAFSPDFRELLIGEDQGRLNLLSVGYGEKTIRTMEPFDLISAPAPKTESDISGPEAGRELFDSGEIMFQRMGALSKRQAIQGPFYAGPYFKPTEQQMREARHALRNAQDRQHEAQIQGMESTQDSENPNAVRDAYYRVDQAQEKLDSLLLRMNEADDLEAGAEELQRQFTIAKHEHDELKKTEAAKIGRKVKRCKLDCHYLPPYNEEDGVQDTMRSKDRVPTSLWPTKDLDVSTATLDDLIEAGLTSKCMTCFGPASKPAPNKRAQCARCFRKAAGLTSKCEQCAAPMRLRDIGSKKNTCERCSFACFRCGKPAVLNQETHQVSCSKCLCTWRIGALGYYALEDDFGNMTIGDQKHTSDRRRVRDARLTGSGSGDGWELYDQLEAVN